MVIACNSTFAYKGASRDVRRIGAELGALCRGRVRSKGRQPASDHSRLIDATTGTHIRASIWDRTLEVLFDLQDTLTHAIVTAVEPEPGAHERRLARARPTEDLSSWEPCQRGCSKRGAFNVQSLGAAVNLPRASAQSDPNRALPRALLARVATVRVAIGLPDPATQSPRVLSGRVMRLR